MKNFRSTQVGATSPNHSSQFNLPPNRIQDILVKRRMSTKEWTDEKHSLYLKFMEATFVNQLYNSKQTLPLSSPQATFSHSTSPQCVRCSSVACGVNVDVEESVSSTSEVSNLGQRRKRNPSASASPHLHFSHRHMFFSHTDTEMSDQNFVDEEEVCHKGKRQNSKDCQ
ncbi:uncharacterized protein G2W53_031467 [Senna tora]|uniref:Uncharacterized protein n=1 Tax=Senna tora TaxID=362788 RepID=A0A834T8V3_9FABA|nr:uncharacterized protein G2W53_031467 [Senna tora]